MPTTRQDKDMRSTLRIRLAGQGLGLFLGIALASVSAAQQIPFEPEECDDCPPQQMVQFPGYPPGWPTPPPCTDPRDPACFYDENTPPYDDEHAMAMQEYQGGGGGGLYACVTVCWEDGTAERIVLVSGPFTDPSVCEQIDGGPHCRDSFVVPWVDNNNDGYHYLDPDDGSGSVPPDPEDDSPFGENSPLSDNDGDGIPNGLDYTKDGADTEGVSELAKKKNVSGLVPKGLKTPEPPDTGEPGLLEMWLEAELGIVIDPDNNYLPSYFDPGADGELNLHEVWEGVMEATTGVQLLGAGPLTSQFIEMESLHETLRSAFAISLALWDPPPPGETNIVSILANAMVRAGQEIHRINQAVLRVTGELLGEGVIEADLTTRAGRETGRDQDGNPGDRQQLKDEEGDDVSTEDEGSEQPRNGRQNESTTGDPVDTARGEFVHTTEDLRLPGVGLDVVLTRSYRSRSFREGSTGPNWTMSLIDTHMLVWRPIDDKRVLDVFWGNGYRGLYEQTDTGDPDDPLWIGMQGTFGKIRQPQPEYQDITCTGMKGFVLRQPNGTEYHFCPPVAKAGTGNYLVSYLNRVKDIHGNAIRLRRNDLGQVFEIIDTLGRSIDLVYDADTQQLETITDWAGRTITYSYDPVSRNLLRVDYPAAPYLDDTDVLQFGSEFEEYTYFEHPEGYIANPEYYLNHNLTRITRELAGPVVEVDYYTTGTYSFDRVRSHTVAGKVTEFTYTKVAEGTDPYAPEITHLTRADYPDGEVELFYHGNGALYRHEVRNGRFDASGQLIPGSDDPDGPDAWWTVFQYNADYRMTERLETTDALYPVGRKTVYVYDEQNLDRYQQGNLVRLEHHPDPRDFDATLRFVDHVYDPITNRIARSTDHLGRVSATTFAHQEQPYPFVRDNARVAGWGILPTVAEDPSFWNLGDINIDGQLGRLGQRIRVEEPARTLGPVAPGDPGLGNYVPTRLYQLNDDGQDLSVRYENGIWVDITYTNGFPSTYVLDSGGASLTQTFVYDVLGRVTEITAADQQTTTYLYDDRDRITWVSKDDVCPPGQFCDIRDSITQKYYYDQAGRQVGKSAPRFGGLTAGLNTGSTPKLETRVRYDTSGNVTSNEVWRYQGPNLVETGVTSYAYDGRNQMETVTMPSGTTTELVRDSRGLVVERRGLDSYDGNEVVIRMEYDEFGQRRRIVYPVDDDNDGQNDATTYSYNGHGELVETIHPNGLEVSSERNAAGLVEDLVGRFGAHEVFYRHTDYDPANQPILIVASRDVIDEDGTPTAASPSSVSATMAYGPLGERYYYSLTGDGEVRSRVTQYDALGRRTAVYHDDGSEVRTDFTFGADGRLSAQIVQLDDRGATGAVSPSSRTTSFLYGDNGRVREVVQPDGSSITHTYNARGDVKVVTSPGGYQVVHSYDSLGRRTSTQEVGPGGAQRILRTEYDIEDNVTAVIDAKGNRTELVWDGLGRLRKRVYDNDDEVIYEYDDLDRLVSTTFPDGSVVIQQYGASGRVETITATGADANVTRQIAYDPLGRPTTMIEATANRPSVTLAQRFTSLGEMVDQSTTGPAGTLGFTAVHDGVGGLETLTYPSGMSVDRARDSLGRVTAISTSTHGTIVSYTDLYGRYGMLNASLAGNLSLERDYDSIGRIRHQRSLLGAIPLLGADYTFDPNGNLTERTTAGGRLDEFELDDFQRLDVFRKGVQGSGVADRVVDWDWDDADNLDYLADSLEGNVDGVPNNLNQLVGAAPDATSISYTARGQESSRSASESLAWEWDAFGRPYALDITTTSGVQRLEWLHDSLGRMAASWDETNLRTDYAYFGRNLLSCSDAISSREYVMGGDGKRPIWRRISGAGEYLHTDPFGNVSGLFDTSGTLDSFEYDPFGLVRDATTGNVLQSGATSNDLFFAGSPYVARLGMSRLGARVYDTRLGRFVSRDPLAEAAGQNVYGYARQNPFRWMDPSGLAGEPTNLPEVDETKTDGDEYIFFTGSIFSGVNKFIRMYHREIGLEGPTNFLYLDLVEKGHVLNAIIELHRGDIRWYMDWARQAEPGEGKPWYMPSRMQVQAMAKANLFLITWRDTITAAAFFEHLRADFWAAAAANKIADIVEEETGSEAAGTAIRWAPEIYENVIKPWRNLRRAGQRATGTVHRHGETLGARAPRGVPSTPKRLLPGVRFNDRQFGKKVGKHAEDFGLDPSNPEHRQLVRGRIESIVGDYDDVRQGPWNPNGGGGDNFLFYRQGADVVVTQPSGDFVTILAGGQSNGWFNSASSLLD